MLSERCEWLGVGISLAGDSDVICDASCDSADRFDGQVRPQVGVSARRSFAAVAVTSVYTPPRQQ